MNMLTAAGVAHVNSLPVLLLPGDVFASRRPDPVLQQVEDWGDGTVTANDCFRPVSRYWDRITRPEQLLAGTPDSVGLLFDTGHLAFAGDDPAATARRWAHRINHVHAKDVRPDVLARAKRERWSFLDSVVAGVYTVSGDGGVDFAAALRPLHATDYAGWMIVEAEQDPAKAHPLTYATAGYRHLRSVAEAAGFDIA